MSKYFPFRLVNKFPFKKKKKGLLTNIGSPTYLAFGPSDLAQQAVEPSEHYSLISLSHKIFVKYLKDLKKLTVCLNQF